MRAKLQRDMTIHQRYKILYFIKEGGFGAVYCASDLTLKPRIVAVKQNLADDAEVVRAFDFEARILATLDHPNLPKVTDYFTYPVGEFLVMDFIEGQDLESMVKNQGTIPESKMIEYALPVSEALHYLHTVHNVSRHVPGPVVHRDVKPANIRIAASNGRVFLVDFGIAKIFLPGTISQMPAVSPGFSPMEQYEQKGKTDARSDVYALGATMYFCLTHQPPPEATVRASNPRCFVSPRQHNPAISVAMETLIMRCMEMEQNQRLQTAQEVGDTLKAIQKGVPPPGNQFSGMIQQLGQLGLYSSGYSRKHYSFLLVTQTGAKMPCELKGYMLPLVLFNGASVTVDGAFDGNNMLQVTKLTDLQTQRGWTPKPTLGTWERIKIELGLMKP